MIWKPYLAERGEGEAGVVGRDAGRDGDGAQMGDWRAGWRRRSPSSQISLLSAVDLDVVDFGLGDAGDAAAEAQDDLVGEAVGDLAGGVFGGFLVVLLGEDLRVLEILGVEEEAVDDEACR